METTETRRTTHDVNPFTEDEGEDGRDRALVEAGRAGDAAALEELVRRHQRFLYHAALRMLLAPADAEDATQEILVKAITKLSSFEGRSRFRTWLWRIATNHLLNLRRSAREDWITFDRFAHHLEAAEDGAPPDPAQVPVDVKLLVEEAKLGCTAAMLLCLDREQRLAYVLGEILGASDAVAAEVLEIGRDAFRQRLARARRDLHAFMHDQCGLVNAANACRCEKKTRAFVKAGWVDPRNLRFARERVALVRDVAARSGPALAGWEGLCADLQRQHPLHDPPAIAARVRELIRTPGFRDTLGL